MNRKLSNWNRIPAITAEVIEPGDEGSVIREIKVGQPLIARGMGKSYGDASLGNKVLDMRNCAGILGFSGQDQILKALAGTSIDEILSFLVPRGHFLPVVPGTRFISLGGAIAADIHGKNHHLHGSFGTHVLELELIDEEGQKRLCSRTQNPGLFSATCGGMGLTGVIVSATIKTITIQTSSILCRNLAFGKLDDLLKAFDDHARSTYNVAWLDTSSETSGNFRALLMLGEHAHKGQQPARRKNKYLKVHRRPFWVIPPGFPGFILNRFTINIFNHFFYWAGASKKKEFIRHYSAFFFPLDAIGKWNRLYGKEGFIQYQCVVPDTCAGSAALHQILSLCREYRKVSFLSVLKKFGPENPDADMSFPFKGYTLAMDLKMNKQLAGFLEKLDDVTRKAGGRIYLAKDARMSREFFEETYPKRTVSGFFSSLLSARLGLNHDEP